MDKTDIKITRYEKDGFWIDIVDKTEDWEAWFTAKEYGVSDLIFGWPKNQSSSYEEFLGAVDANFDEYAELYMINHGEEL